MLFQKRAINFPFVSDEEIMSTLFDGDLFTDEKSERDSEYVGWTDQDWIACVDYVRKSVS